MPVYVRDAAVKYARKWALSRNKNFADFENMGGDCTNFVSQCLFAGTGRMDYTPEVGWYYNSLSDRAAAWSGVEYLFKFLTEENSDILRGSEVEAFSQLLPSDVIQMSFDGENFTHSLFVTGIKRGQILVCTHSYNSFDRPLSSYSYKKARGIHIM
ncbi:methylase [Clostridia bacterium]|nr:methylase [Clostridia bacterium]